jgi:hypothetical protein
MTIQRPHIGKPLADRAVLRTTIDRADRAVAAQ